MPATVWAERVSLKLGFALEDFGYAIDLGLPVAGRSEFNCDLEIKTEIVWSGEMVRRSNVLAERKGRLSRLQAAMGPTTSS